MRIYSLFIRVCDRDIIHRSKGIREWRHVPLINRRLLCSRLRCRTMHYDSARLGPPRSGLFSILKIRDRLLRFEWAAAHFVTDIVPLKHTPEKMIIILRILCLDVERIRSQQCFKQLMIIRKS